MTGNRVSSGAWRTVLALAGAFTLFAGVALVRSVTQAASKVPGSTLAGTHVSSRPQAATSDGTPRRVLKFVPQGQAHNLDEMTKLADVIIDGVVQSDRCVPVSSTIGVYTVAEIQVTNVLKGASSGTAHVAMIGGALRSANGSIVEVEVPDYAMPVPGNRVMAFLWKADSKLVGQLGVDGDSAYVPVNEQLGLYDLSYRFKPFVVPVGMAVSQLGRAVVNAQLDASAFVQLVSGLAK